MIYFFGGLSGVLFTIVLALRAMYKMHVDYEKSKPNLKQFTRVNPDGTTSTYYRVIPKV